MAIAACDQLVTQNITKYFLYLETLTIAGINPGSQCVSNVRMNLHLLF